MQHDSEKTHFVDRKFGDCALLYIIEAMLEYFVALSVADVYLAKIAAATGMSDQAIAVLTSFVSLGCGFQFLSIFFFRSSKVKKKATSGHIISQILFTCAYLIPLATCSCEIKSVLLVIALLVAQVLHNAVNAPKTDWYMSMLKNEKRGVFTGIKEIVSLFGGMAFTYGLAFLFDKFEADGNQTGAFICGAVILGTVTVLHTLTLIFTKEKPDFSENIASGAQSGKQKTSIKELLRDKTLWKIVFLSALWSAANYATLSFSATYRLNELGFSMTLSAIITAVGSVARAVFSVPLGKFGDKKGFSALLCLSYLIAAAAYLAMTFTAPANGKVLYTVYYVLHCVAMAGINGSMINIVYDYVPSYKTSGALAIKQSISGVVGFLVVLALTPLMTLIQKNGNSVFGITIYSQQIFAVISLLIVVFLAAYSHFAFDKRKSDTATTAEQSASEINLGDGKSALSSGDAISEIAASEQNGNDLNKDGCDAQ